MTDVPLREYLESLIREGDERLRVHIEAQFDQVKQQYRQVETALTSADKLEQARLANLERQITLQLAARDVAIGKAEDATNRRLEGMNEIRGQLSDQATTFMPREVADTALAELRKATNSNTDRLNELLGKQAGTKAAMGAMVTVAIIVISLISFLANYFTAH